MSALEDLVSEYYGVVLSKLAAVGGPSRFTPEDMMITFRPNLNLYLPPTGRLMLAHDTGGRLVGVSTLNQVRNDAGELKRLYVRPEANGHGLGRKVIEHQFEEAREMGWQAVLINVIKKNQVMLRICEKMGFRYIERYPECADPADLADFFVYLKYDLN